MSAWCDFYKGRLGPSYLAHVQRRYGLFIDVIASRVRRRDTVLEVGCGMATVTRALIDGRIIGARHICVDDCPAMLDLARFQAGASERVTLLERDIRVELPEADVIHGHGVLEHFSDRDIRKILRAQRRTGARVAIHYVPSAKYEQPSFGDERLMTAEQWRMIAKPNEIIPFNDGHDLALIWSFA